MLIYFSGHGGRDAQQRLFLAAKDYDRSEPEAGGIPLTWLRQQLVACPAKSKLLILDACHAGNARSPQTSGGRAVTAKELGDFFEQTEGLVTLAACRGDQNSYMWTEKQHSIFTYWLIQLLCGHADREPLGEITLNELDDFVTRKVRSTASPHGPSPAVCSPDPTRSPRNTERHDGQGVANANGVSSRFRATHSG